MKCMMYMQACDVYMTFLSQDTLRPEPPVTLRRDQSFPVSLMTCSLVVQQTSGAGLYFAMWLPMIITNK